MDANKFGAFIAEARKAKNWTQADLAMKIQVSAGAVSRWERGVGFPDINTIEPLALALDLSVLELMKSERIVEPNVSNEGAKEAVTSALDVAISQNRRERKKAISISTALVVGAFAIIVALTIHFAGFSRLEGTSPNSALSEEQVYEQKICMNMNKAIEACDAGIAQVSVWLGDIDGEDERVHVALITDGIEVDDAFRKKVKEAVQEVRNIDGDSIYIECVDLNDTNNNVR